MNKKRLFYTGFFVVLATSFYFVITRLIPDFGKRKSPPISYVRPFSFTNQDGQRVSDKEFAGKVFVVEYFFTTCTGVCPRMNKNMKLVYDELKDEPDFYILSHTSDPDQDTPEVLKRFAQKMNVDTRKWIFLTGRKDSLYNTARVSYTLDDPKNNVKSIEDQFIHTQFFALVDRNGDVIKIYDGIETSEVKEMIRDAKKLLKEKTR